MADITPRVTSWFVPGLIPRYELTTVVGPGQVGKSTFAAWLCSQAQAAVILPGHEESLDGMLTTRLTALCPNVARLHTLEGPNWTLPSNIRPLISAVQQLRADLVLLDPLDSYYDDDIDENKAKPVRNFLESLARLARETGAAVIGIRHPGKGQYNPHPGSRQWRNVPRMVVELVPVPSNPPRWYLHLEKDSCNGGFPATYYDLLETGPKLPRRFVLGATVARESAEASRSLTDRVELSKVDVAMRWLRQFLADGEKDAGEVMNGAQRLGVSSGIFYLAQKRLGVELKMEGTGKSLKHTWVPPEKWPE